MGIMGERWALEPEDIGLRVSTGTQGQEDFQASVREIREREAAFVSSRSPQASQSGCLGSPGSWTQHSVPFLAHVMTFWETLILSKSCFHSPARGPGPRRSLCSGPTQQIGCKVKAGQGTENPLSLCGDLQVILGSRLQGPGWPGAGATLD